MTQKAILVAGLGFGDEGKGSIVDYLTRKAGAGTVVRYNGGAQAAHNVITPDGRHHLFAQFGSGTFMPGVKTHLSRFMVVNPISMLVEEEHLHSVGIYDALQRMTVDRDALIVTPIQKIANRIRELVRGPQRRGSCGVGIGETINDAQQYPDIVLCAQDLCNPRAVRRKLYALAEIKFEELGILISLESLDPLLSKSVQTMYDSIRDRNMIEHCVEEYSNFSEVVSIVNMRYLKQIVRSGENIIFEGAQGALLDKTYGFIPHHTKTDMSFANALALLKEANYSGEIERVGVLRGYHTRHGMGPFPTEDPTLFDAFKDEHNASNDWQGGFRVGHFDAVLARYARNVVGGVDYLALTNLDRMRDQEKKICNAYVMPTRHEDHFVYDGDTARDIRVPAQTRTVHQEELTRCMVQVRPLYTESQSLYGHVQNIEEAVGMPIRILSFGPTAEDKIKI